MNVWQKQQQRKVSPEAGESEGPPLSSSEKIPQNPREDHCIPVLLPSLLAARLCLPFSLFSMLVSRPLRKDKHAIAMSVYFTLLFCI